MVKIYTSSLLLISILFFSLPAYSEMKESNNKKFKPCPNSPNCVSSRSSSEAHRIDPLPYNTSVETAVMTIKHVIQEMPGAQLVKEDENYLRFEFTTRFLKFVDDVEIIIDETAKLIHLRSASRTGYWDLGVNRRRIEAIKKNFLINSSPSPENNS